MWLNFSYLKVSYPLGIHSTACWLSSTAGPGATSATPAWRSSARTGAGSGSSSPGTRWGTFSLPRHILTLSTQVREWENMNMDWASRFQGPLLVLHYGDLTGTEAELERQLRRMLEFLAVSVTKENMECVLRHKEGIYRRKKKNGDLRQRVYNSALTAAINEKRSRVMQYIKEINDR